MSPLSTEIHFSNDLNLLSSLKDAAAYVVGGTVRDLLLGRIPQDYDLAVPSNPQAYALRLSEKIGGRLVIIGKPGRMLYRVITPTRIFDVTAFQGASIEADLKNRDFTINAIALNLSDHQIIDCLNGRNDMRIKTIRMTSSDALRNDPIRLIRAYRLAAELSYNIEPSTAKAIESEAHRIQQSPGERIRDEWFKILEVSSAAKTLARMHASGLLSMIFPELVHFHQQPSGQHPGLSLWDEALSGLTRLEALLNRYSRVVVAPTHTVGRTQLGITPSTVKMAALLHDIGKTDQNGAATPLGHARRGADLLIDIGARLKLSNCQINDLIYLVGSHRKPAAVYKSSRKRQNPQLGLVRFVLNHGPKFTALLVLAMAISCGKTTGHASSITDFDSFAAALIDEHQKEIKPNIDRQPLINGKDLIRHFGMAPSPAFKTILKRVREKQILGELTSRQEAMHWLTGYLAPGRYE